MANFLYVDNSNVWIEGMYASAVDKRMAATIDVAHQQRISDHSWKIDFGRLIQLAGGEKTGIGRAVLYGSRPPRNDSLWAAAERQGFEVVVHDRNRAGREKKIDTSIAVDITDDARALMNPEKDEITLVAGDGDYVPVVTKVRGQGFKFYLMFWDHASREMKEKCTQFISLNGYLDHLRLR